MLMCTADVLGYDTSYSTSVESGVSSWETEYVGFVTENGIMNGTGNGFDHKANTPKSTPSQLLLDLLRI